MTPVKTSLPHIKSSKMNAAYRNTDPRHCFTNKEYADLIVSSINFKQLFSLFE
jgi:hypothetical protein